MGEWRYSSTQSKPRQLVEISGQLHIQASSFPREQPPVSFAEEAECFSQTVSAVWEETNLLPLPGIEHGFLGVI
jgi:hypothetical protein